MNHEKSEVLNVCHQRLTRQLKVAEVIIYQTPINRDFQEGDKICAIKLGYRLPVGQSLMFDKNR